MKKVRLYSTLGAIFGGLVFAYVLVQFQYNSSFLLGDVMHLTLPENFTGIYYGVDTGSIVVSSSPMPIGTQISIDISYNPERVSLDLSSLASSHTLVSVDENEGLVSLIVRLDTSDATLFTLPLTSDEEYHIVVSKASIGTEISSQPLAIQRLGSF